MPVFCVSRNKTLLVDSGQESVLLAQAVESLRFPLEQGELHCDSFLKIVWVVWLERVVPNSFWTSLPAFRSLNCFIIATLWSNRVLHAHREADVNQTCQQSVFSPIGACIRIWCTARGCRGTAVANIGLQAFTLFPLQFPARQKACSQAILFWFDYITGKSFIRQRRTSVSNYSRWMYKDPDSIDSVS